MGLCISGHTIRLSNKVVLNIFILPMIMQPITVQVVQEQQKELHFLAGKFLLAKSHQVNLFLWEPPQGFPLTAVFNLKTVCE